MQRWLVLCLVSIGLAGCLGKPPLDIRRDAYLSYLQQSNVGTDPIADATLPDIHAGRKGAFSGVDALGNKCRVTVYVDRHHPMLLHVITRTPTPCEACGGSGIRGELLGLEGVNLRCLVCDGTGEGEVVTKHVRYRVKLDDLQQPPPARQ